MSLSNSRSVASDVASVDVLLIERSDGSLDVRAAPANACKSCGMCGGTHAGPAADPTTLQQPLQLELPGNALIGLAFAAYGVPLAGLLLGALAMTGLGAGDLGALCGAIAGFACALAANRRGAAFAERRTLALIEIRSGAVAVKR